MEDANKKDISLDIDFKNIDAFEYLSSIENSSIDLVLTDPPYIISRESGMNTHHKNVEYNKEHNIEFVKTEEEWETYKKENNISDDKKKREVYEIWNNIWKKILCQNRLWFLG